MTKAGQRKKIVPSPPPLRDIKDWHAVLTLSLFVLLFFRDIVLQRAFLWEDFLYQFYPFRTFAAVSMAMGELPLWNPFTFNGMPFQADIQSALFYLPNVLLTFFVSGERLHFFWVELFIILHYILAGVSMYYLARSFGLQRLCALFSGLVFMLSGFMITHAIHQVIIAHVAWLPLIVLLFRRALSEKSVLHMILAGLVLGHAVLAGFPQLTLYIFLFLFFLFVFEFTSQVRTTSLNSSAVLLPIAAGTIIIAVGLTALQLLPTLELAPLSQRAEISYEKSLEGSLAWSQLITLAVPKFFGASGALGSTYWGPGPYWHFWETCAYVGIPALVFALLASGYVRRERYVGFFFGILFFALLYAVGDGFVLHRFFFEFIPGFDTFRNPGRMALLFSFAAAMLSGFGLRWVIETVQTSPDTLRKTCIAIAAAGAVLWILVQAGLFLPDLNVQFASEMRSMATSQTTIALVFFLLLSALLYTILRAKISLTFGMGALIVLQFADVHTFGFTQNNGSTSPDEYYARTAQLVKALKDEGKHDIFRVNARQGGAMVLDRNQGMVDRLFLMEGYTPLALQRLYPPGRDWDQICDMLNARFRIHVDAQQKPVALREVNTHLPRAFVVYSARVFTDEPDIRKFMESEHFDPGRMVVLEEEPAFAPEDSVHDPSWTAAILSYRLNSFSLNVSTPKDGFLVLSEIYYPGWKAYVDGKEERILRANWNLRAIPIRKGTHTVEIRFEPASFYRGLRITATVLGLSIVGMVYSRARRRKLKSATNDA